MERLCLLREIYRSIGEYEQVFQKRHGLCLNEGMLLCSLKECKMSSGDIANALGLTHSNTSKIIKSLEEKVFIDRILGDNDKRQMYFALTRQGRSKLQEINLEDGEIGSILREICNKIGFDK